MKNKAFTDAMNKTKTPPKSCDWGLWAGVFAIALALGVLGSQIANYILTNQ